MSESTKIKYNYVVEKVRELIQDFLKEKFDREDFYDFFDNVYVKLGEEFIKEDWLTLSNESHMYPYLRCFYSRSRMDQKISSFQISLILSFDKEYGEKIKALKND